MVQRKSGLKRLTKAVEIRSVLKKEFDRTGGIFRLAPTWVGRPGIIIPGRRIKLLDDYISQDIAVNERWLASVTHADNGVYNKICPEDHGLSYIIIGDKRIRLKDALETCGDLLLGKGKKWDVLSKFFDNWHRIPFHMHPCDKHVRRGLVGKPESYHFPLELNMNRNAFPATRVGVDPAYSDRQALNYLKRYFKGDNRLTDLANSINLIPGTGWYMPACTLHAPGSLVTYELQTASDVACIPESRVNDIVMPPDMLDRDLPVSVKRDGENAVFKYILDMINCKDSGNRDNFRKEYFRPPIKVFESKEGIQYFVIYKTERASAKRNEDYYSAKKTTVKSTCSLRLSEKAAFGVIVLRGHGTFKVHGKEMVKIESPSMFETRDDIGGDELFVAAEAVKKLKISCSSIEDLSFCQHFASCSNPESTSIEIPEFPAFKREEQ